MGFIMTNKEQYAANMHANDKLVNSDYVSLIMCSVLLKLLPPQLTDRQL